MKTFVGITGTTCVGKSETAVELAKLMGSVVISADSMQIYRGMDIGTAKITAEEMQGIPHFMLDIAEPNENFSAYQYQLRASKIIDETAAVAPIVAGGTGFYFDSLLYPPEFGTCDIESRQKLQRELNENGLEFLCEKLKKVDFESYNKIDLKNPVRVLRALEIVESGEKRSMGKNGGATPKYSCKLFVLCRERQSLYEMIDKRVDVMMRRGLLNEVERLISRYGICNTTAFAAIGYKELIGYLTGKISLVDAVEQIKLNTRHYAKRQITYFKKMDVLRYVDVEGKNPRQIAEGILKTLINNNT